MSGFLRAACAALLWLTCGMAFAAPRIGVMTMQPGEIFWERFGHDAIVVDDGPRGAISYNYGYFDMAEPDFVQRFVRGEMRYMLVTLPLEEDLSIYREEGRGVSIQWLDLTDTQATKLAVMLAENAKPENARYHYDYFRNNCATKVRDALDFALDGALGPQLTTSSHGSTYRDEATRWASPAPWMRYAFELGLGPNADKPLSRWEEAFIPMHLASALRDAKHADGRPLIKQEETLLPHRLAAPPEPLAQPWLPFTIAGVLIAAALWWFGLRGARWPWGFALVFWLLCGIVGLALAYLWLGSAHWAAWRNHTLLLASPLALLLLSGGWRLLRGRAPGRVFRIVLTIVAICALLAWPLSWLGLDMQRNGMWLGLLLPIHIALFWLFHRGRSVAVSAASLQHPAA